ncbi:MAG TPA: DNA-binding response regulator, partial [Anaerolineales bacterium]|nr:DNA-binding response regulator [Anaerolineales bacterium]
EPSWQDVLTEILRDAGLLVDVASSYAEAEEKLRTASHRLAIVDLSLAASDHNNRDGLRILDTIRRVDPGCTSILLTGFATVEIAVDAIRTHGAYTCLRKDQFRRAAFRQTIQQALAFLPTPLEQEITPVPRPQPSSSNLQPSPHPLGKALLVEDDAGWRSLLTELLSDAGYQVHTSTSYIESLGRLNREKYQLAIVDLSLASSLDPHRNLDGFRLLASTRQANIPTIVVSGHADPERVARAYKEFNVFTCLEKQHFDRTAFLQTLADARQTTQAHPEFESLTVREREVLELLARGLTNKDLAATLHVTNNTIKRHLKAIFKKLDVQTRAAAVAKVLNTG